MLPDMYVPGTFQPATIAAYTNSLILNRHVYVPLVGGGYATHDEAALAIYEPPRVSHRLQLPNRMEPL